MGVDICIVNYFGAADVRRCLTALESFAGGTVWLVDNSADATQQLAMEQLAAEHARVQLLLPGENLGFGRGCNLAFARSSAEFFMLLNPDAVTSAADLQQLETSLKQDPRLAAISPKTWWNLERSFLLPTPFAQTPWRSIATNLAWRSGALTKRVARRYLADEAALADRIGVFEVHFLAGAALMVRRAAVEQAGGLFDPAYFMFYEDTDLSLRLRRAGWKLGMTNDASAVHEYRHKASKGALMAQARDVYFRKRHPRFHRLTAGLARIDSLARPVPFERWYEVLPKPCVTLDDFRSQTGDAAVLAFSPSPIMIPAIFRPSQHGAARWSQSEWDLLEPARYTALLQQPGGPARWIFFERAPA